VPLKTGKRPFKMHAKTLFFEKYAGDAIPEAPEKVYWSYKVPDDQWGMLANDEVGDCVVAGAMHMDMNWTAHTGTMRTYTREQALEIYSQLTGYDPATGANDNGLVVTDFLNFWQTEGFFGSKILGWAQFNHANPKRFNQVDWLFGGVATGVQLPSSAQDQFSAGQDWSLVPDSPNDGGHFIPGFNYGADGRKFVTWAKLQAALNDWLAAYVDEAYGVISEAWFDTVDVAPNHFNKDQLWADLKAL
jgi:hypothetical protein